MVDGFSVVNDPDRVRRRLGFMPDYFGTYSNIDCREYLDFFARAYGLVGRQRHQSMQRVMSFTKLDELAEKPIKGLSKGMKQRLCLARAMIHDPGVLVLDEPAAGLDPRARIELREMIRQLASDGKAVLISSHILTELAEICDRVAIIEQGRLLATGTVDEILHGSPSGESQTPVPRQTRIEVQVIGDAAELAKWLGQRDEVNVLHSETEGVRFAIPDDLAVQADLLRDMLQAGFRVVQFAVRAKSLEDAFLHITQGRVQ